MFTFLLLLTSHILFLGAGIWIGFKNANSSKVTKGKILLDALKGKDIYNDLNK